jgi:DNA-binding MarR family transcriptional regulator
MMRQEMASASGNGQLDMGSAETGLTALLEACDRSVEEIAAVIPQAQLRALLVIDRAGSLNLSQLATALAASASAAGRLCERMELSDLLTRDRAAAR